MKKETLDVMGVDVENGLRLEMPGEGYRILCYEKKKGSSIHCGKYFVFAEGKIIEEITKYFLEKRMTNPIPWILTNNFEEDAEKLRKIVEEEIRKYKK